MEMNVCNANTNWLRGEHDCTKDSKKTTKRERKIKNDLESRLRLGCIHNEHTCTCFVMWFSLVLFMIKYNHIKKNTEQERCCIFPPFPICVQSGLIIYSLKGMVCVCVHMHEQKEACVFERMIRSWGLANECLYKRAEGRSVCVSVCMCAHVCVRTGTSSSVRGPGGRPSLLSLLMMIDAGGPHTPRPPS